MKKYFSLICFILALILILPTLAACKGRNSDNGDVSDMETAGQGKETDVEKDPDDTEDPNLGTDLELEGEHAELISHSYALKNKVNAYYADGKMDSFVIENGNMSLEYRIKKGDKQVTALLNSKGAPYLMDTSDVYIRTNSNNTYYASQSLQAAYPNFYQHGYYYYEVGLEGQTFAASSSDGFPEGGLKIDYTSIKLAKNLNKKTLDDGSLRLVVKSPDSPCVSFNNVSFSADEYNALLITMRADEKADANARIYLAVGGHESLNSTTKTSFELICDGQYRTYCVYLDRMPDYFGDVTDMRIDVGGETGATFEISELRVVNMRSSDAPAVIMNRVYHTYADRLYEMIQIAAYRDHDNVYEIGTVTKIAADTVEKLIIADKAGEHDSLDGVDMESVTYVGFLIKGAGVLGYILPTGKYQGGLEVSLSEGEYTVARYARPENGVLTMPTPEIGNEKDYYLCHRIYTDMTSDFQGLRKAVKDERDPLGESDFTVLGKNAEDVEFIGYDSLTGTYRFTVKTGINSFYVPYYNMPGKYAGVNFSVKSDDDREIYVEIVTGSGQLECAALLDGKAMMLPVPLEVCKNFPNEESPTQIDMLDKAFGNIYFPLKLKGGESYEYQAISLWQNWGRYPLKQLSSIAFVSPYYHLSTGVIETNCITMYPSTTRLPDFRSMSAPLWATQPAHTRGGWHEFLIYTDEDGNKVEEIHKSNEILSYGPTYAEVKMEFISTDGRIKSTYTHGEMPQTDENRTFYTLRYEVLEDISFKDFAKEFSIYSVKSMGGRYACLGYLNEGNRPVAVDLGAADGKNSIFRLGSEYPYFALYTMVDYAGTPTDMGPDNYVNVACLIKSRNITVGGERCDEPLVIVEDGGYVSLSLDLGNTTLRAGDVFEMEMILLPWGSQKSVNDSNVRAVRQNTLVSPVTVTADENCKVVSSYIPTVRSEDGKSASFTLNSPETDENGINMTVRVQGMKKLTSPMIYEKVDGEWQKYEVSSAEMPDRSGNAHAYDGYGVEYAGDGTYTYSFVVTVKGGNRSFKLLAEDDFAEWPEVEVTPEMNDDKLKVYLDPAELYEAAQTGKNMGEIIRSDDESYVTFKSCPGVVESFFVAYSYTSFYESGQYFVIKYRAEKDMSSLEVFTSTQNMSPTAKDNFHLRTSEGMLKCDGEWQVAVVDLSKAVGTFTQKDGSGYGAKYIRLDVINRSFAEEHSIDVAYVGINTSLEEIIALNGDMGSIMMMDGMKVYDLLDESGGEDGGEKTEPLAWYKDPAEMLEGSKTKYTKGFSSIEVAEGGEFARFKSDGESPEGILAMFVEVGESTGKYAVVRYRIPVENPEELVNFEIFTSGVNEVPTSGDNFRVPVNHDGEWHTMVVDLTLATNKDGVAIAPTDDYCAKYFRVDLFNKAVSGESYIDVAFIGFTGSLEDIAAIDENYELTGMYK